MNSIKIFLVLLIAFGSQLHAQQTSVSAKNDRKVLKKAKSNIEKYRKADFSFQLEGIDKSEFQNIQVDVEQTSHEFLFGCIIFDLVNHGKVPLNKDLFKERFKQLFNFAVFPFYWAGYEPQQGQTAHDEIEEVVKWCINNGITCKGHPLVWTHTAGTPGWLSEYSAEESKELLKQRIEKIVGGFENQIEIWDVLNEAVNTVNWDVAVAENRAGKDNRYTGTNLMLEKSGFIDSCFQWAHQANPNAQLILNEFGIVADESLRQQFHDLLKTLQQKNTPVSGVGIQAHEPYKGRFYYSPEQIWSTFEAYSDLKLPMHITEFIPVSNGDSIMGGYKTGIWSEQAQADFAEMIYTLSFGYPGVISVNWWGMSDYNIWQKNGGLVDENLQPKAVYNTLNRLINHEWKTNIENLNPGKNGKFEFRGFKGNYKITVKQNGRALKTETVDYDEVKSGRKLVINL